MTRVKMNVVYVVNVWLANFGEDLEVLLGMDVMHATGIRSYMRNGLVRMPDEEMVVMCTGPNLERVGLDVPHAVVRIQYGHTNPEREAVWAGQGDRRATKIVYQARSWSVAIKVVSVSNYSVWIDMKTPLSRIVQHGSFPQAVRFVGLEYADIVNGRP
ncbi:hypothetical protein PHMEG_0008765 [Phytophthora megakarya]|uniref:Aspartic protease n=1 Tax=Phytophthora megakarya TaxID=4795 RepID=A0A225WJX9_9STRA|nr:hypothetical protein PHMEG_0008765 [Phytophthora megakarya]